MDRKFKYLTDKRVVWRRDPITDIPDETTKQYMFYKDVSIMVFKSSLGR